MKTAEEHSANQRSEDRRMVERLQNAVSETQQTIVHTLAVIDETRRLLGLLEEMNYPAISHTRETSRPQCGDRRRGRSGLPDKRRAYAGHEWERQYPNCRDPTKSARSGVWFRTIVASDRLI
jgi:hypothetical protein